MSVHSRLHILKVASLLSLAILPFRAHAAEEINYPSQPVHIVVPFAAGSVTDTLTRTVAQKLNERLNVPVIVENKPGAGGNIGASQIAKAPPNGLSLLMATTNHTINATLYRNITYDIQNDFTPVIFCASTPMLLVVSASSPLRTTGDLIAEAKQHPGKINFGSAGIGSPQHLGIELFNSMAGVQTTHVPYNGAAPAVVGMLGGQVDVQFIALPLAIPQMKAGKLRALAITSQQRSALVPDVPTVSESGLQDFTLSVWYGVLAPAGTPTPIVTFLNQQIKEILAIPQVQDNFSTLGVEIETSSPREFADFIRTDAARWAQLIRQSGASAD